MRTPKKRSGTFVVGRPLVPQCQAEIEALFPDDAACRRYLASLRWPGTVACPWCGSAAMQSHDTMSSRALIRCGSCGMVSSPVTSTLLDHSPIGLRAWFRGLWEIASRESGADPTRLAAVLCEEEPLVWAWLDEVRGLYRAARREHLTGVVELARVPIECPREGRAGVCRAILAVAVEVRGDAGRCRIERLDHVDAGAMLAFVERSVHPGTSIRTGSWHGYASLRRRGYGHLPSALGHEAELEHVQQIASLLRIWLWSNGYVSHGRLPYYLDEFVFRSDARLRHAANERGALFAELLRHALHEPDADRRTA